MPDRNINLYFHMLVAISYILLVMAAVIYSDPYKIYQPKMLHYFDKKIKFN